MQGRRPDRARYLEHVPRGRRSRIARVDPYLRRAVDLWRLEAGRPTPSPRLVALQGALDRVVTLDLSHGPAAAIARVRTAMPRSALEAAGARVIGDDRRTKLVRIGLADVDRLARLPGVEFVEAAGRVHPELDISGPLTGAEALHEGDPAITGEGVVYGAVDTGIDVTHPTFLNPDGTTRVEAFWDVCDTSGDPPPGFEDAGGTMYTREDIDAMLAGDDGRFRHVDAEGHGTMTTAIGAGSGDEGAYVGMAPGASIVMVAIFGEGPEARCDNLGLDFDFGSSSSVVTLGARFIESIAAGRPFVVNMSIGDHSGPHDGTSLLDQELTDISAPGGRALVASSGNEGQGGVHAGGSVTAGGPILGFDAVGQYGYPGIVEIWYPAEADLQIRVRQGDDCGAVAATGSEASADAYYVDNGRDGVDARNGDHVAYVEVYGDLVPAADSESCTAACDRFTQACGGEDPFGAIGACFGRCMSAWNADRVECVGSYASDWGSEWDCNGTFFECLDVDFTIEVGSPSLPEVRVDAYAGLATVVDSWGRAMTVGQPASARGVIAVGAWVHRARAGRRFEAQGPMDDLTDYSSAGPMRDGRDKPEIVGPAELVRSALAAGAEGLFGVESDDGLWITLSGGTSASSPHVAGAVALLLEADPELGLPRIHEALAIGADADDETGTVPNSEWGWGKLRVDQALAALDTEPGDADGDGFGAAGSGGLDCDDDDAEVSPRAPEVLGNGTDEDCDGQIDEALPGEGFFERVDDPCPDEIEPDSGVDAGELLDAAVDAGVDAQEPAADAAPDAASGEIGGGGCACGVAAPAKPRSAWGLACLLVALAAALRRRRQGEDARTFFRCSSR
ncbi:MAG: S8 family serine peptidase [Deltaproteobacteria bacterium]|nr:S8 family serine peptidase [Deltaproteobacteria bacterium]